MNNFSSICNTPSQCTSVNVPHMGIKFQWNLKELIKACRKNGENESAVYTYTVSAFLFPTLHALLSTYSLALLPKAPTELFLSCSTQPSWQNTLAVQDSVGLRSSREHPTSSPLEPDSVTVLGHSYCHQR